MLVLLLALVRLLLLLFLLLRFLPFGLCHFGTATPDSISYVCQYIDKKFTGDLAKIEYEDKGRAPVFRVSSLGIGRKFLEDNKEQLDRKSVV